MRVIKCVCNRCGSVINEDEGIKVKLNVIVKNDKSIKTEKDFCQECYNLFNATVNEFCIAETEDNKTKRGEIVPKLTLTTPSLSEKLEAQIQEDLDALANGTYVNKFENTAMPANIDDTIRVIAPIQEHEPVNGYKKGPFTKEELSLIVKRCNDGETAESIAKDLNRKASSIRRIYARYKDTSNGKTSTQEEEPIPILDDKNARENGEDENLNTTNTTETDNFIKSLEEQIGRKIDVGKVMALANAGWSPIKISYEMSIDISVIKDVISYKRSK
jgi:hypothetical protein